MRLQLSMILALVLVHGVVQSQQVVDRAEKLSLIDEVTSNSVSLRPSLIGGDSYTLKLSTLAPGPHSLMHTASDGTVQWLAIGSPNLVLASDGSTIYWTHPFAIAPGWLTTGTSTTNGWNGALGGMLGPLTNVPLSLVTRNATTQSMRFFTGVLGASERSRIGSNGGFMIGTISPPASTLLSIAGIAGNGFGVDIDLTGSTTSHGVVIRSLGNTSTTNGAIILGTTSNGIGTALRVGVGAYLSDPDIGIEIESTSPLVLSTTAASTGIGLSLGSVSAPWMNGLESYSTTVSGQVGRGLFADASSASASLAIGSRVHAGISTGEVTSLVASSANDADVYLGSTSSDSPAGLSLLSLGGQTSMTRMHGMRASGLVTFRGTGTGATSFQAGDQGAVDISYVLPTTDPSASNTVLVTSPSGQLSWSSGSGLTDIFMELTSGDGDIVRKDAYRKPPAFTPPDDWSTNVAGGTSSAGGRYSGILAGDNVLVADPTASAVLGGKDSFTYLGSHNSIICGGTSAIISDQSTSAFIGAVEDPFGYGANYWCVTAGSGSSVSHSTSAFIGAGYFALIISGSNQSALLAGDAFIDGCANSFVGSSNTGLDNSYFITSNASGITSGNATVDASVQAFVGAGNRTTISTSANRSAVIAGGGAQNVDRTTMRCRIFQSTDAAIIGGRGNQISSSAHNSTILGGEAMWVSGGRTFAFGSNTVTNEMEVSDQNLVAFSNVNVWLTSNSGQSSQLRFYEGQASSGSFPPPPTRFVGIRAPQIVAADHTYILPALPTSVGMMLAVVPSPPFNQLYWVAPSEMWTLNGETVTSSYASLGPSLSTSDAQPLVLATAGSVAQDIRFYTGSGGSAERVRITGAAGHIGVGTTTPSATIDVAGTCRFGTDGTTIANVIHASSSVNLPSIAAGTTHIETISVSNVVASCAVKVTVRDDLPHGLLVSWSRVSAAGVVSVAFHNVTASAIDAAAMDFSILAVQ